MAKKNVINGKTFFQARKEIRVRMSASRAADRDQSEVRLHNDGKQLDKELIDLGYELEYPTTW